MKYFDRRCSICDDWYSLNDPEEVAVHAHPEPQSGEPRQDWRKSGMSYQDWITKTPEGMEWEKRRKEVQGREAHHAPARKVDSPLAAIAMSMACIENLSSEGRKEMIRIAASAGAEPLKQGMAAWLREHAAKLDKIKELCDEYFLGYWDHEFPGARERCVYCKILRGRQHIDYCPVARYQAISSIQNELLAKIEELEE